MKRIISIILSVIMALTVSVSFSGCGDDAPNSSAVQDNEVSADSNADSSNADDVITAETSLEKMKRYIEFDIDMSEYTLKANDYEDENKAAYNYNRFAEVITNVGNDIELGDGTVITLFKTRISDLIANGYNISEVEDNGTGGYAVSIRRRVILEKDGKKLYLFISNEDLDVYKAVIRDISLQNTSEDFDYNYYGITKDSYFSSLIDTFGNPTRDISCVCNEDGSTCSIKISYYCGDGNNESYVNFWFDYRPEFDKTEFTSVYIST